MATPPTGGGPPQGTPQSLSPDVEAAFSKALEPVVGLLRDSLQATQQSQSKSKQQSSRSSSDAKNYHNQSAGFLKSIVQNISLPLPGGARLFGLSSFMDKLAESRKALARGNEARKKFAADEVLWGKRTKKHKADDIKKGIADSEGYLKHREAAKKGMTKQQHVMNAATIAVTTMATAVILVTEGLRALGKQLGGVSEGEAFKQMFGAIGQTFAGLAEGRLRFPGRTLEMQGAAGQEFGQLATSEAAATMADVVTDFGITTNQMAKLERTFQATAMDSRTALKSFADVGILGQTASTELAANAGAVARAGDNFNEFIVEGIKNAKTLGLEFSKMESKLTGFTTNFEGTVSGFSELRAVIPGFATDFGQLLSTAMTGTTDEYIDQIRSGLLGSGIRSASDLNRQQAALLEQATGFSADQIDRIIAGEDINFDIQKSLDTSRNYLLIAQMGLLGGILGAVIAGTATTSFGASIAGGSAGILKGAAIAGSIGAGTGLLMANDILLRPGKPAIEFNKNDKILAYQGAAPPGASTSAGVESKLDQIAGHIMEQSRQQEALSRRTRHIKLDGLQSGVEQAGLIEEAHLLRNA